MALVEQQFVNDDDNIYCNGDDLVTDIDQVFFEKGFSALVSRWDMCLIRGGDYIEK
jgi:hypothetical protein